MLEIYDTHGETVIESVSLTGRDSNTMLQEVTRFEAGASSTTSSVGKYEIDHVVLQDVSHSLCAPAGSSQPGGAVGRLSAGL